MVVPTVIVDVLLPLTWSTKTGSAPLADVDGARAAHGGRRRHRRARNRRRRRHRRTRNRRRLGRTGGRRGLEGLVFGPDDEDRIGRVVVDDSRVGEDFVRGRDDDDGVVGRVAGLAGRVEDPVDLKARVPRQVTRHGVADLRATVEDPESDVDGIVLAIEDADVRAKAGVRAAVLNGGQHRRRVRVRVGQAGDEHADRGLRLGRVEPARHDELVAASGMLELDAAGAVRRVELRHDDVVEGPGLPGRQRERRRVGRGRAGRRDEAPVAHLHVQAVRVGRVEGAHVREEGRSPHDGRGRRQRQVLGPKPRNRREHHQRHKKQNLAHQTTSTFPPAGYPRPTHKPLRFKKPSGCRTYNAQPS